MTEKIAKQAGQHLIVARHCAPVGVGRK